MGMTCYYSAGIATVKGFKREASMRRSILGTGYCIAVGRRDTIEQSLPWSSDWQQQFNIIVLCALNMLANNRP